ncbi:hypothetical protein [Methylobacterium brachythecii]|uniref:Uncharacterized protein n=1 Tax=Methylobacterium brachythecii TaxID=1176177 RepID=A0A7W6F5Z5_9HYPH|nr:hypothetical protein [Methylobacterium brachythecii]MBB3901852.1 hypothetical protein [Methylobacterium brachythecii]GLS43231.1 hypothetical protein GCM10007884_12160 [Methylobacterium brachythecii]
MSDHEKPPEEKLPEINAMLAEWTARSADDSAMLLERLKGMGYDVAGKSEDEIAEILKKPPTRPASR